MTCDIPARLCHVASWVMEQTKFLLGYACQCRRVKENLECKAASQGSVQRAHRNWAGTILTSPSNPVGARAVCRHLLSGINTTMARCSTPVTRSMLKRSRHLGSLLSSLCRCFLNFYVVDNSKQIDAVTHLLPTVPKSYLPTCLGVSLERQHITPNCWKRCKEDARNGAIGAGFCAPKAGALPGCATPRQEMLY